VPIARAGSDQTLLDADGDGFVTVALDGSASTDPDGGPLSYVWRIKGQVVSTVAAPALLLPEGQHLVRLIVTDRMHQTDSDAVVVTVNPKSPGENRLVDPGFESADTSAWTLPDGASLTNTNVFVHSGTSALKIVHTTAQQDVRQRVPITPGATYVVSGWMKTQGLTPIWSTLSANVLDASGTVLDSFSISRMRGNSPYAYAEQVILTPSNAAAIEIVDTIDAGAGTGSVLLDDLQVRDRNLLENGDFEVRSPDGSDRRAPGWDFIRPGRVADGPSLARAGRRSLELASLATNYQLVQQVFPHVSGRTYRVSAWIRTDGATTPPTLNIRRLDSGGANLGALPVPVTLSEGSYTLVERTLTAGDLPPTTASLQIEVRFEQGLPGTARFDDFLVELLP
jgi:hypothetical protein